MRGVVRIPAFYPQNPAGKPEKTPKGFFAWVGLASTILPLRKGKAGKEGVGDENSMKI